MRPTRRFRILTAAGSTIICVVLLFTGRSPEPRYKGKTLSKHLTTFAKDGYLISSEPPYDPVGGFSGSPERSEAWEALGYFGEESVPRFVQLAGASESRVTRALKQWCEKLPLLNLRFETVSEKQSQAVWAFICYGSRGQSAVPGIPPLLHDQSTARAAIYSLAFIKPEDEAQVLQLTNLLLSGDLSLDAMAALAAIGPKAAKATPMISQRLTSTNDQVSAMAAVVLARIGGRTPETATLIAGHLSSASSQRGYPAPPLEMYLWALGEFGPAARDALPVIARFTNGVSGRIRRFAQDANRRIQKAGSR